jgi:PAS domain S-box-containing protein
MVTAKELKTSNRQSHQDPPHGSDGAPGVGSTPDAPRSPDSSSNPRGRRSDDTPRKPLRAGGDAAKFEMPDSGSAPLYKQALLAAAFVTTVVFLDAASTASQALEGAPTWYLPVGLMLALLLCGGMRYLPVVIVASLAVEIVNEHRHMISWSGIPAATILWLPYVGAVALLRGRWRVDLKLATLRDAGRFALILLAAAIPSALAGTLFLWGDGLIYRSDLLATMAGWWAGDAISIVAFTPFLLVYVAPGISSWLRVRGFVHREPMLVSTREPLSAYFETAAQFVFILGAIWVVFDFPPATPYQPLYLLFIPVIWAAVRRGVPGAVQITFSVNIALMIAAYVTHSHGQGLPRLQMAMLALALIGLCLGAVVSERKQAEEELQFKTAFLEAQADSTIEGIQVVDGVGQRLTHNRQLVELLKIPSDVLLNKDNRPLLDHVTALVKNPESFLARTTDLYEHPGKTGRDELEFKDGLILDRYSAPVVGKDGKYYGRIWTFRDITERKRSEQTLQKSEERFRQLAENIHEVFWMMSPAGDEILYVSPAYEQVWGRKADALYQNPMAWADAIHPDDKEQAHALFGRQLKGEQIASEYRIRTPDGQEKWISDRAFPVRDEAGLIIRVVGIAEEITARREAERELRLTQFSLEQASDAIFWTDSSGRFVYVNNTACRTSARSREELLLL